MSYCLTVLSSPLTVVSNKSGEQQVKEALKKAEQEAEKAAKDNKGKEASTSEGGSQTAKTEMPQSASDDVEEQANKRMKAMAAKLNNLVLKFQRKVMASKYMFLQN